MPPLRRLPHETFGDTPPLIAYVTGLLGSFLPGRLHRQEFYVLTGPGATGKSTLVRILQSLMGDYALDPPQHAVRRSPR
jgi:phage/plasmid-associated DNA primase